MGSLLLAIFGGWNYMKGRINLFNESVRMTECWQQAARLQR